MNRPIENVITIDRRREEEDPSRIVITIDRRLLVLLVSQPRPFVALGRRFKSFELRIACRNFVNAIQSALDLFIEDGFQLWKRFKGSDSPPEELGPSRDYNVDMIPKFMMANGALVHVLIHTNVTKYHNFKAVDGSFVYNKGKTYLGIQISMFYFKCTKCSAEITMKTDPQNSDYVAESGAARNFDPWRVEDEQIENNMKLGSVHSKEHKIPGWIIHGEGYRRKC